MIFNQSEFQLRCEWGFQGVAQLAPISDVIIIVDILSFSTSVEIATNNDAIIFPYQWRDESALDYAKLVNATFSPVQDELPAVPLPREQLSQDLSDDAAQEIPDW
jgi:2-phosphosulfolactate phosphatase